MKTCKRYHLPRHDRSQSCVQPELMENSSVDVDFVICLGYFLLRIFLPHLMSHDMHHRGIIEGHLE